jgi:hypothetical protein
VIASAVSVTQVRTAVADELPRRAFGVTLAIFATDDDEVRLGGAGPNVEYARGFGRWQLFGEGCAAVVGVNLDEAGVSSGLMLRAGAGVRVQLRAWHRDEMEFDLIAEGVAGVAQVIWDDGTLTRPDVGAGLGYHVRPDRSDLTIRILVRMMIGPVGAAGVDAAPRATEPEATFGGSRIGLMGVFGADW